MKDETKKLTGYLLKRVLGFYLSSRDFNGIPLCDLYKELEISESDFKSLIESLIEDEKIELIYEGEIPNPHIKPFPAPKKEDQIKWLKSIDIDELIAESKEQSTNYGLSGAEILFSIDLIGCCIYPTKALLSKKVDWRKYESRPFALRLAMGEWQLRPYFFELSILSIYRNDPRYSYVTDDITGSIYTRNEESLKRTDRVHLKYFYFGFDRNGKRAVAVLLCDLWKLSTTHQKIWEAKLLPETKTFFLHPDARKMILGHFPEKVSIFTALLKEIEIINMMSIEINGIPIFKHEFQYEEKPENFGFLLLPTRREYDLFCNTLDKVISENINESFFEGEILQADMKKGQVLKELRGITKLDIWLSKKILAPNRKPINEMIATFRKIRSLRSVPSHEHIKNEWSEKIYTDQKKLVNEAYTAIRTLRLILTNHPRARKVKVPEWLFEGEIRSF
jgi:hypothetical protein